MDSKLSQAFQAKALKRTAGRERRQLLNIFRFAVCVMLLLMVINIGAASYEPTLGALLIFAVALLPSYLWCKGKVLGMPIFPLFALTHLWTCAIPVYSGHREVELYSPEEQLFACLTVASFLALGTFVWYKIAGRAAQTAASCRSLEGNTADTFFLFAFAAGTVFSAGQIGGWFSLGGGVLSVVRGILFSFSSLATFVLAYRWGGGDLSRKKAILFVALLGVFLVSNAASLLLVGALSTFALALVGYSLARRSIPVVPILVGLLFVVPLHYGKAQMRDKYFAPGAVLRPVQLWEYPVWFAEWYGHSVEVLLDDTPGASDSEQVNSFLDRNSTIHLLLLVQRQTAQGVPMLYGDTYLIIPRLFIPRLLDPEKPASHEGNYLLNIHYGLQSREDTAYTTIGWGLLNEAYANFGLLGGYALAVILGSFYGYATRWSANAPHLSARALFAMLLLNLSIQSEFSASVYLTALFQATVSLGGITLLFMRTRTSRDGSASEALLTADRRLRSLQP